MKKVDEEDAIALVYDKLPNQLQQKITPTDQVDLDAFTQKISKFQEIREKPKRQKFALEYEKEKSSKESVREKPDRSTRYDNRRSAGGDNKNDKKGDRNSGVYYKDRNSSGSRGREYSGRQRERNNKDYRGDGNSNTWSRDSSRSVDRKNDKRSASNDRNEEKQPKQVDFDLKSDKPSKNYAPKTFAAKKIETDQRNSSGDERDESDHGRDTDSEKLSENEND